MSTLVRSSIYWKRIEKGINGKYRGKIQQLRFLSHNTIGHCLDGILNLNGSEAFIVSDKSLTKSSL